MRVNRIDIWEPKYSTKEVLVASKHIKRGLNEIYFSKTDSYRSSVFTDSEIRSYPSTTVNGLPGYALPLSLFPYRKKGQQTLQNQTSLLGFGE